MCDMDGKVSRVAVFAIVLLFAGIASSSRCDQDELMRCSTPLPGLGGGKNDVSISLSREELNLSCLELKAGIRCINNYTEHCMKPPERARFNSMYEGVDSVMSSLCQAGRYQDDYLRHAACIKNVKPEYELCSGVYERALGRVSERHVRDSETGHEYLRTVCCSFQDFLACTEQTVRGVCGEEAAAFTSQFLTRMSSAIIKSFCLEYRGAECAVLNSGAWEGPSWVFVVAITTPMVLLAQHQVCSQC